MYLKSMVTLKLSTFPETSASITLIFSGFKTAGYLWLQNGGRTLSNPHSHYTFDYVLIQDEGKIDCTTDAVTDEGITFYLKAVTVEGGGILQPNLVHKCFRKQILLLVSWHLHRHYHHGHHHHMYL
jgi:hypothetical protein